MLSYTVLVGDGSNLQGNALLQDNLNTLNKTVYHLDFQATQLGTQILAILLNDRQLPNSPVRFTITKRDCSQFAGRIADIEGNCICSSVAYFESGGACIAYSEIFPSVILPATCLFLLSLLWLHQHHIRKAESLWKIKVSNPFL